MRTFIHSLIVIMMTVILAGMVMLGLTGCSDENLVQPENRENKIFSASPDELMENFALVYGGRDLEKYAQLLHDDFVYTFDPETAQELGPSFEFFNKDEELICAANLFSGETVVNSRGQSQPAILAITFHHWSLEGDWTIDQAGHLRGVFEADISFYREGSSTLRVTGRQVFTVAATEDFREVGGSDTYYQVLGWQDLTNQ